VHSAVQLGDAELAELVLSYVENVESSESEGLTEALEQVIATVKEQGRERRGSDWDESNSKWQLLYISSKPESLSWVCAVAVSSLLLAVSKHASDRLLIRLKLKFSATTFPLLAALYLGLGLLRHLLPFPPLLNCELAGCSGETLRARVVVPSDVV